MSTATCNYATADGSPCQNPVNNGSTRCAAGHEVAPNNGAEQASATPITHAPSDPVVLDLEDALDVQKESSVHTPSCSDSCYGPEMDMSTCAGTEALWGLVADTRQLLDGRATGTAPTSEDEAYAYVNALLNEIEKQHSEVKDSDVLNTIVSTIGDDWTRTFGTEMDRYQLG